MVKRKFIKPNNKSNQYKNVEVIKNLCDCTVNEKENLGKMQNSNYSGIYLFFCKFHKTFMKHDIITGKVVK